MKATNKVWLVEVRSPSTDWSPEVLCSLHYNEGHARYEARQMNSASKPGSSGLRYRAAMYVRAQSVEVAPASERKEEPKP